MQYYLQNRFIGQEDDVYMIADAEGEELEVVAAGGDKVYTWMKCFTME